MTQTAPEAIDVAGSSGLKRKGLCDYLIEFGKLSPANAERALRLQSEQDLREPIGTILVKLGYVTERNVAECLAMQLALPLVEAKNFPQEWPAAEQISHKSDVGGVQLNLRNAGDVRTAFEDMYARLGESFPDASLDGVMVQPMASGGRELILGGSQDKQFGPVVLVGLGVHWWTSDPRPGPEHADPVTERALAQGVERRIFRPEAAEALLGNAIAADPDDEPPGVRAESNGLVVGPGCDPPVRM